MSYSNESCAEEAGGVIRLMVEHTDRQGQTTLMPLTRETQFVIAANLMRAGAKQAAPSSLQASSIRPVVAAAQRTATATRAAYPAARTGELTKRELQVFDLLVSGMTNKLIAHELSISPRTVEIHRAHVLRKLRVPNVAGLIRVALDQYLPAAA